MSAPEPAGRTRITLLTDIDFWQQSFGSHSRILALLNGLSAEAEIDVLSFRAISPEAMQQARRLAPGINLISHESYAAGAAKRRMGRGISHWAAFSKSRQEPWITAVAEHFANRPSQIVIVEYVRLGFLLDGVPKQVLRVLDLHDVMFQRRLSFAHFGQRPSIVMSRADEVAVIDAFDIAIAITTEDAALLAPMLRRALLVVVPHTGGFQPLPKDTPREAGRALFIGADTPPNRDGLNWFLQQVWPAVPPWMTLCVAGDICKSLKALPRGVTALGRIKDVAAFYASGEVAINPVFYGGGMKIKTLEAMLHGVPIVTTREGAKGMAPLAGLAMRVADGRAAFLGHLLGLLGDAEKLERSRHVLRDQAAAFFAPERAMADLLRTLRAARG